jgi:hypothetical protein
MYGRAGQKSCRAPLMRVTSPPYSWSAGTVGKPWTMFEEALKLLDAPERFNEAIAGLDAKTQKMTWGT